MYYSIASIPKCIKSFKTKNLIAICYQAVISEQLLANTVVATWLIMDQSWLVVDGWLISHMLETCGVQARNIDNVLSFFLCFPTFACCEQAPFFNATFH